MLNVILGSVTGTQVSYESIQDIAETKVPTCVENFSVHGSFFIFIIIFFMRIDRSNCKYWGLIVSKAFETREKEDRIGETQSFREVRSGWETAT
jgi:hypothetical protein